MQTTKYFTAAEVMDGDQKEQIVTIRSSRNEMLRFMLAYADKKGVPDPLLAVRILEGEEKNEIIENTQSWEKAYRDIKAIRPDTSPVLLRIYADGPPESSLYGTYFIKDYDRAFPHLLEKETKDKTDRTDIKKTMSEKYGYRITEIGPDADKKLYI